MGMGINDYSNSEGQRPKDFERADKHKSNRLELNAAATWQPETDKPSLTFIIFL